ncbi:hypothetical protein BKA80DRAFT_268764 [Phyllosticta citrichinensis]
MTRFADGERLRLIKSGQAGSRRRKSRSSNQRQRSDSLRRSTTQRGQGDGTHIWATNWDWNRRQDLRRRPCVMWSVELRFVVGWCQTNHGSAVSAEAFRRLASSVDPERPPFRLAHGNTNVSRDIPNASAAPVDPIKCRHMDPMDHQDSGPASRPAGLRR